MLLISLLYCVNIKCLCYINVRILILIFNLNILDLVLYLIKLNNMHWL
jgi:hypothetical protein